MNEVKFTNDRRHVVVNNDVRWAKLANDERSVIFKNDHRQAFSMVGVSGGEFSPLDLSPNLWLDGQDNSTITIIDGKVSQWGDKSGNNNHAIQNNATYRPRVLSDGFGQHIRWDNLKYGFEVDNFNPSIYHFFTVIKADGASRRDSYLGSVGLQAADSYLNFVMINWETPLIRVLQGNGSSFEGVNITPNDDKSSIQIIGGWSQGAGGNFGIKLYTEVNESIEEVIVPSTLGHTFPYNKLYIGLIEYNELKNSNIYEIFGFNYVLNETQRSNLVSYIKNKWSIS